MLQQTAQNVLNEGIKKATEYGTEAAIISIDALSQTAINNGVLIFAVHNVSNFNYFYHRETEVDQEATQIQQSIRIPNWNHFSLHPIDILDIHLNNLI